MDAGKPMSLEERFCELLRTAMQSGASDVHIVAGSPVRLRIKGKLVPVGTPIAPAASQSLAVHILRRAGRIKGENTGAFEREMRDEDCAYSAAGIGRFRANICRQRGSTAIVLRAIPMAVPAIVDLGLPLVVEDIAVEERGLILVTGATGSGKSTTLASIISRINALRPCKIVTIEDPIEFVHRDQQASIVQREIGCDTASFAVAIRASLRQDPDVILVGEMRDRETVDIALKAAETGHLVLSTVHTPDAPKTLNRLLSFFDSTDQQMLRIRLSDSLVAVISQRLLPRADGSGRVPAIEILRSTPSIRDCILYPEKTGSILDYVRSGRDQYRMQTFDQHLMELYESGTITVEVARNAATSPAEFERNLVYS